jgi:hypothetical protein
MQSAIKFVLAVFVVVCSLNIANAQQSGNNANSFMTNNELNSMLMDKFATSTAVKYYRMEDAMKSPQDVLVLDLSSSGLKSVSNDIGKLTNLVELNLSGNELTSLPEELSKLAKLASLDVSHNQLTDVPKQLCALSQLKDLKLGGNRIKSLKGLSCLKSLEKLSIPNNEITEVSSQDLEPLKALKQLIIYGNELKSFPDKICEFNELNLLVLPNDVMFSAPSCLKHFQEVQPKFMVWTRLYEMNYSSRGRNQGGSKGDGGSSFQSVPAFGMAGYRVTGNGHYTKMVNYPRNFKKVTPVKFILFWGPLRYVASKKYRNRIVYTSLWKIDDKIDKLAAKSDLNTEKLEALEKKKEAKLAKIKY